MKHVLEFAFSVLNFLHIQSLSILTDSGGQNIQKLDTKEIDFKSVDGLRQLLNQETIIRISLVKNVYTIMKDMADLKQSMVTMEMSQQKTELKVTALQQEVNRLKGENSVKLILENTRHEDTSNALQENITQMNENIIGLVKQFEVDRETFEKNASARLENLNVTLYELNKHALEIDKSIQALIDQKYEIVSTKLNASLENLNNELFVSRTDISKSFLNLENSQKAAMSSMLGDLNKTIEDIRTEVMQSKSNQMKLSSSVSSLEVFQMNITRDVSMRVAFTAGVTSDRSSWNSGTLVYDVVINNVGGGYNRHTGIFTAPVEGDYVFYVSIKSYQRNSIFVDIVLNGSSKVRAIALGNAPFEQYETGTNLVTLRLQQGDTVWVRYNNGQGFWTHSDTPVTTFSGFLI